MPDVSKNRSLLGLEAFAAGLGDSAFQGQAEELRSLVGENVAQDFSPANSGRPKGLRYTAPDRDLALNIKNAWISLYGAEVNAWPQRLQNSLATIEAGIGLESFNNNVTAAFQNLRLEDVTIAALEAGVAVARGFSPSPLVGEGWGEGESFIPESAARAGLSFISSPFALMVPMWGAGIAGRTVTGLTANIGRALSLADEAIVGVATLFGLVGESAAFVGASSVIQHVAEGFSPPSDSWNPKGFRYEDVGNDTLTEIAASTAFFASLRLFGAAGIAAQKLLPLTVEGAAIAKLTGHATSIFGLASTEEIQAAAGIGTQYVAQDFSPATSIGRSEDLRYTEERTFYASLWRAAFLHGTVQAVNGVINLNGARSDYANIRAKAEALKRMLEAGMPPELVAAMAGASGKDIPTILRMAMAGKTTSGGRGLATTSKDILDRTKIDWEDERSIKIPLSEKNTRVAGPDIKKHLSLNNELLVESFIQVEIDGVKAYLLFATDDLFVPQVLLSFSRPTHDRVNVDAFIKYRVGAGVFQEKFIGVAEPLRNRGLGLLLEHVAWIKAGRPGSICLDEVITTNQFYGKLKTLQGSYPQWPDLTDEPGIVERYKKITGLNVKKAEVSAQDAGLDVDPQYSSYFLKIDLLTEPPAVPIEPIAPRPVPQDKPLLFVFDLHGTLLQSTLKARYHQAYKTVFGRKPAENWIAENVINKKDPDIAAKMSEESGRSVSDILDIFRRTRMAEYHGDAVPPPMKGAVEFVDASVKSGIPVVVSTASLREDALRQLRESGFLDLIPQENVIGRLSEEKDSYDRAKVFEALKVQYPNHTIVYFDDWVEATSKIKDDVICVGILQGSGEEVELSKRVLVENGVHYILPEGYDPDALLKLFSVPKDVQLEALGKKIPVAEGPAVELIGVVPAERPNDIRLHVRVSDDLESITYGLVDERGVLKERFTIPSSYLVTPLRYLEHHLSESLKKILLPLIKAARRLTTYKGITVSWDLAVDKDVWTFNIDTGFENDRVEAAGAFNDPSIESALEVGTGGAYGAVAMAQKMPNLKNLSVTDISIYALRTARLMLDASIKKGLKVRYYWGKGIRTIKEFFDFIEVNPPYIPVKPSMTKDDGDPYRGTGLIREMVEYGIERLNPNNPNAWIAINISSLAAKDFARYVEEFGDRLDIEKLGEPLKVPLKIGAIKGEWLDWLISDCGLEVKKDAGPDEEPYWHTLQVYSIKPKTPSPLGERAGVRGTGGGRISDNLPARLEDIPVTRRLDRATAALAGFKGVFSGFIDRFLPGREGVAVSLLVSAGPPEGSLAGPENWHVWASSQIRGIESEFHRFIDDMIGRIRAGDEREGTLAWINENLAEWKTRLGELEEIREKLAGGGALTPEFSLKIATLRHDLFGRSLQTLFGNVGLINIGLRTLFDIVLAFGNDSPVLSAVGTLITHKLAFRAAELGVKISAELTNKVALAPHVDLNDVKDVLENLVENGMIYTRPGEENKSVVVSFDRERRELRVKDTGIGMMPEFAAQWGTVQGVREGRAVNADGTPVKGTGTGSVIVRRLIGELGWDLRIESTQGVGTEFIITIPERDLIPASEAKMPVPGPKIDLREAERIRQKGHINAARELIDKARTMKKEDIVTHIDLYLEAFSGNIIEQIGFMRWVSDMVLTEESSLKWDPSLTRDELIDLVLILAKKHAELKGRKPEGYDWANTFRPFRSFAVKIEKEAGISERTTDILDQYLRYGLRQYARGEWKAKSPVLEYQDLLTGTVAVIRRYEMLNLPDKAGKAREFLAGLHAEYRQKFGDDTAGREVEWSVGKFKEFLNAIEPVLRQDIQEMPDRADMFLMPVTVLLGGEWVSPEYGVAFLNELAAMMDRLNLSDKAKEFRANAEEVRGQGIKLGLIRPADVLYHPITGEAIDPAKIDKKWIFALIKDGRAYYKQKIAGIMQRLKEGEDPKLLSDEVDADMVVGEAGRVWNEIQDIIDRFSEKIKEKYFANSARHRFKRPGQSYQAIGYFLGRGLLDKLPLYSNSPYNVSAQIVVWETAVLLGVEARAMGKNIEFLPAKNLSNEPLGWQGMDAEAFEIIVEELMWNAVKYSPDGGTVEIKWDEASKAIIVTNEGTQFEPGFDPFQPGVRGKNVGDVQGTGYGLYAAKADVERNGWRLTYSFDAGRHVFKLELAPKVEPPQEGPIKGSLEDGNGNGDPTREVQTKALDLKRQTQPLCEQAAFALRRKEFAVAAWFYGKAVGLAAEVSRMLLEIDDKKGAGEAFMFQAYSLELKGQAEKETGETSLALRTFEDADEKASKAIELLSEAGDTNDKYVIVPDLIHWQEAVLRRSMVSMKGPKKGFKKVTRVGINGVAISFSDELVQKAMAGDKEAFEEFVTLAARVVGSKKAARDALLLKRGATYKLIKDYFGIEEPPLQ